MAVFSQKSSCQYCGKNPVPHFVNWYFETLNVLLAPVRKILLHNFLARAFKKIGNIFWLACFRAGQLIGLIRLRVEAGKCKVPRAKVLWEEAQKRGILMSELLLFNRPLDIYVASSSLGEKNSELIFSGLPRPENYDDRILETMDDKAIMKDLFRSKDLPIAQGGPVWNFWQAKKIFQDIQNISLASFLGKSEQSVIRPVIVKPRLGSRGRHSTTYIYTEADLKKAFKIAKQLCFWVMVEEMLEGPVYRATVINYKLAGVLRGDPPTVTGDGAHTISELIEIKNRMPHEGVKDIIIDAAMEMFLSRQNLNLLSIIKKDEVVNLSEKVGVSYGGSSSEDFNICHPDNKELFVRAAKIVGDPIVGFDFIIPDIAVSYKKQSCGFIEANSLPFINLHHDPLHGSPRNVAAAIWDMMRM